MILELSTIFFAFALTLFAGLSTGIGSAIAFFYKRMDSRFLSGALGFSAGVMIYVSMIEIFFKARDAIEYEIGPTKGYWYTTIAFFGGMLIIGIIDKLIPAPANPHEPTNLEDMDLDEPNKNELMRMGLFSAIAISIHNFPEGIATFVSALQDPTLGISIAIAVAIHNIPEGVSVSVPIYYATKNKNRAFLYSFLSGLSEPLGAMVGYIFLYRYLSGVVFGLLFAAVAGIMVFISLDELLPTAEKYGEHHIAIYGVIAGMVVMALSLLLFA
ncbi:zinc transporter ZupT [Candidatus Bathyarchaeota archaeon]|nr:zinc transporter ZupT [Candidatus Bathyarchaeota archaeon]